MKKLFKILRNLLVFVFWTILFVWLSNFIINLIWRFDFMSSRSWSILSGFWNDGGVIKTASDVLLLSSLFLLPFLWLIGFILALKIDFFGLFLKTISFFGHFFSTKNEAPERIVIKNLKSSEQLIDEIKSEIDSLKPQQSKKAGNIRSEITKKLSQEIKN